MTLDWENFKDKFHSSWHRWMKPAIESEWMWEIYNGKDGLRASKDRVLPSSKDVFKSFQCDYDNIKAVIVLSDPYPWVKNGIIISDGIPMSCSNTGLLQSSLEQFYQGMENEYHEMVPKEPNLSYLLKQGVFLINTALTVKLNKVGSHQDLWKPFMKYLFEEVLYTSTGLAYWMMGKEAQSIEKWISPLGNYLLYSSHPAAASHKGTTWSSEGNFKRINGILLSNKSDTIYWNKNSWEAICELPF